MEMEKKNLAIIILAVVLAASGIGNIVLAITGGLIAARPEKKLTLVYGLGSNPAAIDPCDTWDIPSHPLQDQVVQSLVEYDLTTHPNYTIKMELATDYEWLDNKTIIFRLRDNVFFHDNNPLTAAAVKWNFERAAYFFNGSGTLVANETSWEGFPSSLFFHSSTGEFIFKGFAANETDYWMGDPDEPCMTFTIELNFVFGAFLDLLCFGAIKMLSPESTPRYRYVELATEQLIGTGPYQWIHFKRDREVRMERWGRYWGTAGYFEVVIFRIIEDTTARMTAGLAGQFDYVGGVPGDMIDTFKGRPDEFIVEDVGEDLCYFYLEIYCGPKDTKGKMLVEGDYTQQKNPSWLRRVMALAINYTYIYDEIQGGYAVEGVPAVPRAMPGHNESVKQAHDYKWEDNIKKAREIMQQAYADEDITVDCSGWDTDYPGTSESDWKGANLIKRKLKLNQHFGSTTNLRINQLLADNFALVGLVTAEPDVREWGDYLDTGENTPWVMDIGYIGWCPDYLNPFNMIDPLFNLASASCFSRINDTGLTALMNAGATITNMTEQLPYWEAIQSYIYDIDRPLTPASHAHVSGWVYLVQSIHKKGLMRDEYNVMQNWHIERWYYEE